MSQKYVLEPEQLQGIKSRASSSRLAEDSVREEHLDRIGRMVTNLEVETKLGRVAQSQKHGSGYLVTVPVDPSEQPVTDFSEEVWGLLLQETTLFHELGHVLWTDFDYLEEVCDSHEHGMKIKQVWNGLEDGCIETFLSEVFTIEADLRIVNTNLTTWNHENVDELTPFKALQLCLVGKGFHDDVYLDAIKNGEYDVPHVDVLVEFEDRMEAAMDEALQTEDSQERIDIAVELTEEFIEVLPDDESDESKGSEDSDEGDGEDSSGGQDQDGDNGEQIQTLGGASGSGEQEESPPDIDQDADTSSETSPDMSEKRIEQEKHQIIERQVNRQSTQEGDVDNTVKQLEEMATGSNLGKEIYVPDWDPGYGSKTDAQEAQTQGRVLSEILERVLQQERSSSRQYGQEDGYLDTGQLAGAVAGNRGVRWNEESPEDKSYSVQIVLDRSSSMDTKIRDAQRAVLQLAHALSMVEIDVSILSFYQEDPYLELPFGGDVVDYEDQVLSGKTGQTTPLGDIMEMSQEHITNGDFDNHFTIVVTDGKPTGDVQKRKYKELLNESPHPVYGVYIGDSEDHDAYFDYVTYATGQTVEEKCRELCESMIHMHREYPNLF